MSNIKIQDVDQRIQYTATSSQTEFVVPFPFFENTDLTVWQNSTELTITTHYTVSGAGSASGGLVTLVSGATLNDIITIQGLMPIDRTSIYSATISNLTGTDLNNDFNRDIVIAKQLETTQELLQLQYKPYVEISQDKSVTVDRWLPILGANQGWAKNSADTEIVVYDLPEGGAAPKDAQYLVQVADADLPNAQAMGALATGVVINTTTTGVQLSRILTGTTGQIDIANGDGLSGNPTFTIASNPTIPGSEGMVLPKGTTAQRPGSPTEGEFRYNETLNTIEAYNGSSWISFSDGGLVDTIVGTANEIDVDATDPQNPVLSLSATLDAPGTFTVQNTIDIDAIIDDDTMATATATNIATSESIVAYVSTVVGDYLPLAGGTMSGNIAMGANSITGMADPTNAQDAATKAYVDSRTDPTYMDAVLAASTGNFTSTYDNGTSGVGATLTASSNGAFSLDGEAGVLNARYLMKNQSTTYENGIYTLTQVGDGSNPAILTRATDFDQADEIDPGDIVPVLNGTANASTAWVQTATVTTIGTDAIVFTQWTVDLSNVVTIDGTQTITGAKTFDANVVIENSSTLTLNSTTAVDGVLDEDDMVSDSATDLATQQSIKAYVDSQVASVGGLASFQIFTSGTAATYTKPAGVASILVECIGGGGGGGGVQSGTSAVAAASGGGAGGYCRKYFASAASSYTYTVGGGGSGGAAGANNGSAGVATTFDTMSAGGGAGGFSQIASAGAQIQGTVGAGGSSSNGDINVTGGAGHGGVSFTGSTGSGGGGDSHLGGGAAAVAVASSTGLDGNDGNNYGGGGGGATTINNTTDRAGGDGADGIIIVWEFT